MSEKMKREIMSVRDLAKFIGVAPKTIQNWRSAGAPLPPTLRLGTGKGKLFFLRKDVMRWLEERSRPEEVARRGRPRKAV